LKEEGAMAEEATNTTGTRPPLPVRHLNALERGLEHVGDRLWADFRKRPYVGAVMAGGVGLALASIVGVTELAVAGVSAYACFLVLKNRESPAKAIREACQLEKEVLD
jgi:hypothetical protein